MYIEHIKYYSDYSRWLAKLFLQFCHECKCQFLMFESSVLNRRDRFDWLVNHPRNISGALAFFETKENLFTHYLYGKEYCSPVFYRHFMWRYFLITHQKNIPTYFKSYIGVKQLVSELKKDGTRNDIRLERIFNILVINNE